jgi:hypothetical protein
MRVTVPTVKQRKFSHCTDQTLACIDSIQLGKEGTSPRGLKSNQL